MILPKPRSSSAYTRIKRDDIVTRLTSSAVFHERLEAPGRQHGSISGVVLTLTAQRAPEGAKPVIMAASTAFTDFNFYLSCDLDLSVRFCPSRLTHWRSLHSPPHLYRMARHAAAVLLPPRPELVISTAGRACGACGFTLIE